MRASHGCGSAKTMDSLPLRQFRSGLGEVIKYGIIYDAALFGRLERDLPKLLRRDPKTLAEVVARCCEIKAEVVSQEDGQFATYNFATWREMSEYRARTEHPDLDLFEAGAFETA